MEFFSIRQDGDRADRPFFHNMASGDMKNVISKLIGRESTPERVGPRVRALRECLELSKSQLADSIELDRSSMTKVENGEAGLDIAKGELISTIYGFGLDFIYRGDLSDVPLALRPRLIELLLVHQKER
ncbi:MAG: helix-turn-helix transcriptional regulator [Pseudomonadota bacterium]